MMYFAAASDKIKPGSVSQTATFTEICSQEHK